MSKDKQTFTDPKSGEEVESTRLARWVIALGAGLIMGLITWLLFTLFHCLVIGEDYYGFYVLLPLTMFSGAVGNGLYHLWVPPKIRDAQGNRFSRWIHDGIARTQHRRRQRILRSKEQHDVPDTAISRAQPPGEPQATDTALSMADDPDEPGHLTAEIEEHTEDQVPVRQ